MNRKIPFVGLVFLFSTMLGAQLGTPVRAEDATAFPDLAFAEAGWFVEGTGTCFEVTGSQYLNITLTSSETVHLFLESVPGMVSFTIERNSSATSALLAFSGFETDTTYYRHQDGYLIEEFTADSNGAYAYTQDISEPHHVYIQEYASTLHIYDDYCFSGDIYENIVVEANNIVIDGNGYTLQGPGPGYGIYLFERSNVTIKNVTVKGWTRGILLVQSGGNDVSGNTITDNTYMGIWLVESSGNTVYHNNIINNTHQAFDEDPAGNYWHHPVLLEGNYWSDYPGVDDGSGTGKHAVAGDGIGDTSIPWPWSGYDSYPFVLESGWLDTTAPVTELTIGTHYVDEAGIYVTSETEFTLSATDDLSGVAYTYYRVNGGGWTSYSGAFSLGGSDGTHIISYYSVDAAGNEETAKSATVILVSLKLNSYMTDGDFNPVTCFDVVFAKDKSEGYRLVATNPGQFYYNIEVRNDWPITLDALTVDASIPADFVLKGAVPIHVYLDGGDVTGLCTIDGAKITVANMPAGSQVCVTIHVDYALKYQHSGIIYDTVESFGMKSYTFAVIVSASGSSASTLGDGLIGTYSSTANLITHQKKTTAIAGFVTDAYGSPIAGATVELFDSESILVGSTATDEGGFYYFIDIPVGDYTIQVTYDGKVCTGTATAVSKELTQVDFKVE